MGENIEKNNVLMQPDTKINWKREENKVDKDRYFLAKRKLDLEKRMAS
jgi:hypothetical protein